MRLKMRGSHLKLQVREQVEVVERNKDGSPFLCCLVNRQCLWKETLAEKKENKNNKKKFFKGFAYYCFYSSRSLWNSQLFWN